MSTIYVEKHDNAYWIADTRVSLDSIVYAFLNGQSAESIPRSFPALTLEQVYGAITYYPANRAEIDSYLNARRIDFEAKRQAHRENDAMFYLKLADAKRGSKKMVEST